MSELHIRPASSQDLEVMVRFNLSLAKETEDKELNEPVVREGVAKALNRPELARYFIAEKEGRVVAQTMLTMEWSDWRAGSFWWIQSVYVEPDFRGQKVFSSIYRFIQNLATKDPECCGLRLYVELENKQAIQTYEKLGMARADYQIYEVITT